MGLSVDLGISYPLGSTEEEGIEGSGTLVLDWWI